MGFRKGQIVRIARIDDGDELGWLGFEAEVAEYTLPPVDLTGGQTKLVPLSPRPDARYPEIEEFAWFFWPTDDLELVDDGQG